MIEALRLFERRPLPALGLGGMWLAVNAVVTVAGGLLADLAPGGGSSLPLPGLPVPDWLVGVAGATTVFAAVGAPLLVGVCAAGLRSARQGAPTCEGLLAGFRHYGASFAVGALVALASTLLALAPTVGALAWPLVTTLMLAALFSLADRRSGPLDALGAALSLVSGRLLTLIILNVCAMAAAAVGVALAGLTIGVMASRGGDLGLLVSAVAAAVILAAATPITVLLLGVGHRDALEVSGLAATEAEG